MSDPDEFYIPDEGDPWQQQMEELEEQLEMPHDSLKPEGVLPLSNQISDQAHGHSDGNPF